jgi:hypothetical protein
MSQAQHEKERKFRVLIDHIEDAFSQEGACGSRRCAEEGVQNSTVAIAKNETEHSETVCQETWWPSQDVLDCRGSKRKSIGYNKPKI